MIDEKILKNEEKVVFALRDLYRKHGYQAFFMSKFEEYDLYRENKDFLIGEGVITFNDTDGRLLALKPDVTLSIIKNTADEVGCKSRVYYNENVYRISGKTHHYKEIMQAGLECIGDTDIYDIFEVIYLAAMSLRTVSRNFVLDISHMGILSAILGEASSSYAFSAKMNELVSNKNKHEAKALCEEYSVSLENTQTVLSLFDMCGNIDSVLSKLEPLCKSGAAKDGYDELSSLASLLKNTEFYDRVRIDFSVTSDLNYYSGIVFKGFILGVYESVLSGGEYGKLMRRMGRTSGAVGFALYLDLLDILNEEKRERDVDVLLVYDEKSDMDALLIKKKELIESGKSVSVQRGIPEKLRYGTAIKI